MNTTTTDKENKRKFVKSVTRLAFNMAKRCPDDYVIEVWPEYGLPVLAVRLSVEKNVWPILRYVVTQDNIRREKRKIYRDLKALAANGWQTATGPE
jgi:hypothetical protein